MRCFKWLGSVLLLLTGISAGAAEGAPPRGFRFAEVDAKSLGLWEGDRPVLVYNHGVVPNPAGVPADRARSTYVHPLYGLDGEVLTDDFPKDHYHHRGLFWAWPHVNVGTNHYDLWMLKGVEQRFERWLEKAATADRATLGVENGWYVGGRRLLREEVRFTVHPTRPEGRAIDVDLTLTALGQPVSLLGAEGKSYGGLTLRFGKGTNVVITIPDGVAKGDLAVTNLPWSDLALRLDDSGRTSGAAIFVHPSHPDFPPQWLLRHYGVLCLGWPGVQTGTLTPDTPVRLRYRVWVHRGTVGPADLQRAYDRYRRGD